MIRIPSREDMYAPTIVAGDDEWKRGINIGITVEITRNGPHYLAGLVTMIATDCFEVTHDAGATIVRHDPGPGVRQVVTVHYPDDEDEAR